MAWFGKKSKDGERPHEIVFYTYPKFLFTWPVILLGYILWPIHATIVKTGTPGEAAEAAAAASTGGAAEVLAWIWILVLLITVLTIGIDIGRNAMAFWVVVIAATWILGMLLKEKQFTIVGDIYKFFARLDASYDRGFGLVISIWLTIPYVLMFIWSRINDKWRFTHNEFEHRAFGKVDWSAARAAKTVRTSYPDLLEAIICLAGDLIIYDARGSKIIRRIPHVPLLPLVRKHINVLLEYTAVTTADIEDEQSAYEEDSDDGDRAL